MLVYSPWREPGDEETPPYSNHANGLVLGLVNTAPLITGYREKGPGDGAVDTP